MMVFNKNTFKTHLKNFYLITRSFIIIISHIYLRLFLEKRQYTLEMLRAYATTTTYILFWIFITWHLVLLLISCHILYKKKYNIKTVSKFMKKLKNILDIVYWNPLLYLHDQIAPSLPYSGYLILKYITLISKYNLANKLTNIFDFTPKIITAYIFFCELIFLNRIYYFLYCIPFLLIPLVYQVFLKLCESFIQRNQPIVEKPIIITPQGRPNSYGVYTEFRFDINPNYINVDLQEHAEFWMSLLRLHNYILYVRMHQIYYIPYVNILCSSLYLIAGLHKIIIVFH